MSVSAPPKGTGGFLPTIKNDAFSSEEGVLNALIIVRNSPLPPDEKAAIRDLFLDFAGEEDLTRREIIKQTIGRRLAKNRFSLAVPTTQGGLGISSSAIDDGVGFSRLTPTFEILEQNNTDQPNMESVAPPTEQKATPETPKKEPLIERVKPETQAAAEPVPETEPQPVKITTVTAATPANEPPPPNQPPIVPKNIKARIDEIKHDVNSRVGNPVNLINADATIGKAYMSALLNAMKKLSSSDLDAQDGLAQLEVAYKAVNGLLSKGPIDTQVRKRPVAVTKSEPREDSSTSSDIPPTTQSVSPSVNPPILSNKPDPSPTREVEVDTSATKPEFDKQAEVRSTPTTVPAENPATKPAVLEKPATVTPRKITVSSSALRPTPPPVATNMPKAASAPPNKLQPVSSSATTLPEKIAEMKRIAEEKQKKDHEPITDLMAEKVTAGLRQLLSEWSIFKSKGWFRSGPSGIEHPLYKELSDLPMAAVVAGRFEGANPDIKQALTDYMNGWRYEQGIVHDMGETFENYLRRVIVHILEREVDPLKHQSET